MERWYSIVEYARKFNLSDMTVRRRIKNGKLQAVLKEGKYYIPISASQQPSSTTHENDEVSTSNLRSQPGLNASSGSSTVYPNALANTKASNSIPYSSSTATVSSTTPEVNGAQPYIKTSVLSSNQERPSSILRANSSSNNIARSSFQEARSHTYQTPDIRQIQNTSNFIVNYENLVQQFKKFEKILEDSYTSKINQLESELKIQKLENSNLKQQVEDLQVLIKLIEKRK